ncbi:MAG: hypothetical protein IJV29_19035 [Butyrivibrio sp.]|nr:hypothetical protein [Butyrivibrio sp.]MBQ7431709.1 hypothetical protein [Butyrivibrio sp.]
MKKHIKDFILMQALLIIAFSLLLVVCNEIGQKNNKGLSILLSCMSVSCIHEIGHFFSALICKIPIYGMGFEFRWIIPRAYTKVNLKGISKNRIILFYLGGIIGTGILLIILFLFNEICMIDTTYIQMIAFLSIMINLIPIYKNDGYYIMKHIKNFN